MMDRARIKVCGLKRPVDIEYVKEAQPDYCGFIVDVPRSKRSIDVDTLKGLVGFLGSIGFNNGSTGSIIPVGVFVDDDIQKIAGLVADGTLTHVQLHGSESEEYIQRLRQVIEVEGVTLQEYRIIKAFSIKYEEDVRQALKSSADYILLDQGKGGTGETFDWSIVGRLRGEINRPFFLAGGIGPDNVERAIEDLTPWAVDLSSSLETDGLKDRTKILEVVNKVKKYNEFNDRRK